jgi:hypothetical protein
MQAIDARPEKWNSLKTSKFFSPLLTWMFQLLEFEPKARTTVKRKDEMPK